MRAVNILTRTAILDAYPREEASFGRSTDHKPVWFCACVSVRCACTHHTNFLFLAGADPREDSPLGRPAHSEPLGGEGPGAETE